MALNKTQVSELYVAIFNRASEKEGNNFWQGREGSMADIANAMLATDPAKAFFGDALEDNEAFVQLIYQNTKGSEGDAEGVAFWTDRLDNGVSRGELIEQFIESLNHPDNQGEALENQKNFQNRVEVSNYAADTIDVPGADIADIDTVLGFGAEGGLQGVTADAASVAAVKVKVDQVLNPVDPLVAALDNLAGAIKAESDFLKEVKDGDDITDAQAKVLVGTAVDNAESAIDGFISGYSGESSDRVQEALVADMQDTQAQALVDANKALDTAEEAVGKVPGLAAAIELLNVRLAAKDNADKTQSAAVAAQNGAEASYETGKADIVIPGNGEVTGLIVLDAATKRLKLADGVTEAKNPGVGALLNAIQARVDADAAASLAGTQVTAALAAIGYLDAGAAVTFTKDAIFSAFSAESKKEVGKAESLTQVRVQVELNKLRGEAEAAEKAGASDAVAKRAAFDGLESVVDNFEGQFTLTPATATTAAAIANAPTASDLLAKQFGVAEAEKAITNLTNALAKLEEAKQVESQLEALEQAIEDAEAAFKELGVEPELINGVEIATAGNDLFTIDFNGSGYTVFNFNQQGEDKIYVGVDYDSLLQVAASTPSIAGASLGDSDVLDIFAQQQGANVDLYVEKKAFAGNASGVSDLVKITLNGVSVDDLVLEDGFLFIA